MNFPTHEELIASLDNESDDSIFRAFKLYVETVRKAHNNPNWLPQFYDHPQSHLFERILSGKKPLELPPPTKYSAPWYQLIEEDIDQECMVEFLEEEYLDDVLISEKDSININQCIYMIKEKISDVEYIVRFEKYEFQLNYNYPRWFVQLVDRIL